MNTVLLCRDSAGGRQLARALAERGIVSAIVLENGRPARRRKLKRMLRRERWWQLPRVVLDALAIAAYSWIVGRALREASGRSATCQSSVPILRVDDVNETACISWIATRRPDVVVVFGTSILDDPLIRLPRKYVLNVHGGILPRYRNVHSDFWAMFTGDYDALGTTIVFLDAGIDTGDVALSETFPLEAGETIVSVKRKNMALAERLTIRALELAAMDRLPRIPQDPAGSRFFRTPGFVDLTTFVLRRRFRAGSRSRR